MVITNATEFYCREPRNVAKGNEDYKPIILMPKALVFKM